MALRETFLSLCTALDVAIDDVRHARVDGLEEAELHAWLERLATTRAWPER